MRKQVWLSTFICVAIGLLAVQCETFDRELRQKTEDTISDAERMHADEYAPETFDEAQALRKDALGLTSAKKMDKKNGKNKKANAKMAEANTAAQEAYTKAAPKYTQEMIEKANSELEKADKIKADVAVPELYSGAKNNVQRAVDKRSSKNYNASLDASESALEAATKAYETAKEKRDNAQDALDSALNALNEANSVVDDEKNNPVEKEINKEQE